LKTFAQGGGTQPPAAAAKRLQKAMETGAEEDLRGLSREERNLVQSFRRMQAVIGRYKGSSHGKTRPGGPPRTIDEVLERAGEDGTHSILDISHVGRERDFGVAVALAPEVLEEFFGTAEPSHEDVEDRGLDLAEDLDRWEAVYFVVYQHGRPHAYAFVGCSGD
jgi:hypothetical protein